jgi:hypothetical protein
MNLNTAVHHSLLVSQTSSPVIGNGFLCWSLFDPYHPLATAVAEVVLHSWTMFQIMLEFPLRQREHGALLCLARLPPMENLTWESKVDCARELWIYVELQRR